MAGTPTTPPSAADSGSAWPAFLGGLGLVLVFALVSWGLRVPLAKGFQKVWPVDPPKAVVPTALPAQLKHTPPADPNPKKQWTPGEVSAAVTLVPGEIYTLIREGRQELRQLEDPGNLTDPVRQQRARMFLQTWGRTFGNRLKLVDKKMPDAPSCAAFPDFVKGCREIHIALDGLRRATNMTTVAATQKTLEQTGSELEKALAPPPPPEEAAAPR